jgi:hypothetical protein
VRIRSSSDHRFPIRYLFRLPGISSVRMVNFHDLTVEYNDARAYSFIKLLLEIESVLIGFFFS